MSSPNQDPREQLLAHLCDDVHEEQRRQMELALLEDDDYFDELRAAEAELLDSYVQGELDDPTSLRLAELVGRSSRLRESAETTLALHLRQTGLPGPAPPAHGPRPGETDRAKGIEPAAAGQRAPRPPGSWLAWVLVLAILLASWQVLAQRQASKEVQGRLDQLRGHQQSLETEIELLEREVERLREEHLRLQRRWAERETSGD